MLPAAIDKAAYVAMAKRNDNAIRLYSCDFKESFNCSLDDLVVPKGHWAAYMLGVVQQVKKYGFVLTGFNAVLISDVPVGGGMSSSAAIECAMIFALNELFDLKLERLEMVKLAKKAENEFVGVQCGIMDMFASIMGKEDAVIRLDCRSLLYEYFPLNLYKTKIVLFDTQVKHSLAGGEYNMRRKQCEEGVALLQPVYPKVESLRDVNFSMLDLNLKNTATPVVYNRCRFIVEENLRVPLAAGRTKQKRIPEHIFELFPVLKQMLKRRGGDLSGGQQQQLAIGRALVLDPTVLILDEPTEGIQPNVVKEIGDVLVRLNREMGVTILLVEQKLPFARRVAQEFCILDRGRVAASGAMGALDDVLIDRYLKV